MARRSLVTFGVLALASAITSTARADDPPGQPAPREPEKPAPREPEKPAPREPEKPAPREPEPVAPSTWGAPTETAAPTSPDTSSEGATPSTDAPPVISGHDTPPLGVFPTPGDELIDPRMARRWGEGPARWFLATTVDVGFVYGRPRASIGYGKPFTSWLGLDVNPVASSNGLGAYGGLRLELPFFDVRGGVRYFSAFSRTYLDRKAQYDRLALETESDRGAAKVVTLETEADLSLPLGPGNILARGSVSYVTNVPDGFNVFEETLRVIVQPPFVWRGRAGYAFRFGKYQQHSLAVVADFLHVPARDDYRTLRIGPVIRFVLSRRVEVRGSFVTTAYSIDKIGLRGGDFTELGVRYRWATE